MSEYYFVAHNAQGTVIADTDDEAVRKVGEIYRDLIGVNHIYIKELDGVNIRTVWLE